MRYNNILELIPEFYYPEFCKQMGIEEADLYQGKVIGIEYECDFWYGWYATSSCITEVFEISDVEAWVANEDELWVLTILEAEKDIPDMSELISDEIEEETHEEWMAQELAWYNHARMMGWE